MKIVVHLEGVMSDFYHQIANLNKARSNDTSQSSPNHPSLQQQVSQLFHCQQMKQQTKLQKQLKKVIKDALTNVKYNLFQNVLNGVIGTFDEMKYLFGVDSPLVWIYTPVQYKVHHKFIYTIDQQDKSNREIGVAYAEYHSPHMLSQKYEWIKSNIGGDWCEKMVMTSNLSAIVDQDTVFISCSDVLPGSLSINCKRVVVSDVEQPRQEGDVSYIRSMKDWKDARVLRELVVEQERKREAELLKKMDIDTTSVYIPYYYHGSADSKDDDVVYIFPHLPSAFHCRLFLKSCLEDRNIAVMKNGIVSACFIGLRESVNNGLLDTYHYHSHKQKFPLPENTRKMKRSVILKIMDSIIQILCRVRNIPRMRDIIVDVVQTFSLEKMRNFLSSFEFDKIAHELDMSDDIKYIAFRLGQSITILEGKELFTKQRVSESLPELAELIARRTNAANLIEHTLVLNKYSAILCSKLQNINEYTNGHLNIFSLRDPSKTVENWAEAQCRTLVIDSRELTLQFFGIENRNVLSRDQEWPEDDTAQFEFSGQIVNLIPISSSTRLTDKSRVFEYKDRQYLLHGDGAILNDDILQSVISWLQINDFLDKLDDEYYHVCSWNGVSLETVASRSKLSNLVREEKTIF